MVLGAADRLRLQPGHRITNRDQSNIKFILHELILCVCLHSAASYTYTLHIHLTQHYCESVTCRRGMSRTRRSTRPARRWPGARGSGCRWRRSTGTARSRPRTLERIWKYNWEEDSSLHLPTELDSMHLVLYSPTPPAGMHQGAAGARRLASSSSRAGAVMAGAEETLGGES